jgi:hypothetical protein
VRVGNLNAAQPHVVLDAANTAPKLPYTSDTGQLKWYLAADKKGLVVVNTARWQALIGYPASQDGAPGNFAAEVESEFCAITLASLDARPIAVAERLLLTTGGRAANQNMKWNGQRTSVIDSGTPGMLIEQVTGTVTLRGLRDAKSVEAVPLDGGGRALGAPVRAAGSGNHWTLRIGETVTPWYLLRVER